jgi:hypothetical protein
MCLAKAKTHPFFVCKQSKWDFLVCLQRSLMYENVTM